MALLLTTNFEKDIQDKDTALYPVIQISGLPLISTNVNAGTDPALPILLDIPSLKESIDIETRKYKISNVSISLSNYEYEGLRLSERVSGSLINKECDIYWLSPSTTMDDAFLVYHGVIRRYDMDADNIKFQLEDLSQSKLHKDLPIANLGAGDEVPDRYKNKPIPMVFGEVNKSPCVISSAPASTSATGDRIIIWDNTIEGLSDAPIVSAGEVLEENNLSLPSDIDPNDTSGDFYGNPLMTFNQEEYLTVKEKTELDLGGNPLFDYSIARQYYVEENKYVRLITIHTYTEINPLIDNNLMCHYYKRPNGIKIDDDWEYEGATTQGTYTGYILNDNIAISNPENLFDNNINTYLKASMNLRQVFRQEADDNGIAGSILELYSSKFRLLFDQIQPDNSEDSYIEFMGKIKTWATDRGGWSSSKLMRVGLDAPGDINEEVGANWYTASVFSTDFYILPECPNEPECHDFPVEINAGYPPQPWDSITLGYSALYTGDWRGNYITNEVQIGGKISAGEQQPVEGVYADQILDIDIDIYDAILRHHVIVGGMDKQDFYIGVKGRAMQNGISPTAPQAISHIMEEGLGVIEINVEENMDYYGWKYDFTINEKINSKKLLENIASASPYIPRFNNRGDFKFDNVPMGGGFLPTDDDGTVSENHTIKGSDVINFKFNRTKIEDVYTKIELKYNWDYGREAFNDSYSLSVDGLPNFSTGSYDRGYYGFPSNPAQPPGVYDLEDSDDTYDPDQDSTLIIEDDRGKYIRKNDVDDNGDGTTAVRFVKWLLSWHCNQHLTMNLKLPLKYLNLEVGDIIKFDEILGGVKPYGINYTAIQSPSVLAGGQTTFDTFLITSTDKKLDLVEISCIQMHDLSLSTEPDPEGEGAVQFLELISDPRGWAVDPSGDTIYETVTSTGAGSGCTLFITYDTYYMVNIETAGNNYNIGDILYTQHDPAWGDYHQALFMVTGIWGAESIDNLIQNSHFFNGDNWNLTPNWTALAWWQLEELPLEQEYSGWVMLAQEAGSEDYLEQNIGQELIVGEVYTVYISFHEHPDGADNNSGINIYLGDTSSDQISSWYESSTGAQLKKVDITYDGGGSTIKIKKIDGEPPLNILISSILLFPEIPFVQQYFVGDINNDDVYNVLDVVNLANCVLAQSCGDLAVPCTADLNGDGIYNVLDIVALVNCVLAQNCNLQGTCVGEPEEEEEIVGGEPGVELILNPGFDLDTLNVPNTDHWIFSGFFLSANAMCVTGAEGGSQDTPDGSTLAQNIDQILLEGRTYQFTMDVAWAVGGFQVSLGDSVGDVTGEDIHFNNIEYTLDIEFTGGENQLIITTNSSGTEDGINRGMIDNLSLVLLPE